MLNRVEHAAHGFDLCSRVFRNVETKLATTRHYRPNFWNFTRLGMISLTPSLRILSSS